jgi:hypothetical protein
MLKKNIQRLHKIFLSHLREAGYIALVAIIGSYMLISSHAASPEASVEAETGSLSGNAIKITNSSASGGAYVQFGSYSSSSAGNFYGINWHPMWINDGGQDDEINLMQQAGIKSVRLDAEWAFIEPSPGVYNQTYLDRLDNAIDVLDSKGIDPLVVIASTPAWVSGAPSGDPSPTTEPPIRSIIGTGCNASKTICTPYNGAQDYDTYLSYLMNRWAGKVNEYEVWNEPDGGWSWQTTQSNYLTAATDDAIDYTTLLKSAYTTAKAIDPNVLILGPSLSNTQLAQQTFLKTVYAQGGKAYFNVYAQHYYCDPPSDNYCGTTSSDQRTADDPQVTGNLFETNMYPIMQANGDGSKPIWITETGYNSYTAGGGISEALQGQYLTQSYQEAKTLPNVARLYWYEMDDTDTGTTTQNYYGIINADTYNANSLTTYRLKPAYTALQQLAAP